MRPLNLCPTGRHLTQYGMSSGNTYHGIGGSCALGILIYLLCKVVLLERIRQTSWKASSCNASGEIQCVAGLAYYILRLAASFNTVQVNRLLWCWCESGG